MRRGAPTKAGPDGFHGGPDCLAANVAGISMLVKTKPAVLAAVFAITDHVGDGTGRHAAGRLEGGASVRQRSGDDEDPRAATAASGAANRTLRAYQVWPAVGWGGAPPAEAFPRPIFKVIHPTSGATIEGAIVAVVATC